MASQRFAFGVAGVVGLALASIANAQWAANGTSVYYNGGNVGIGTNTPFGALTAVSNTAPGGNGVLGVGHSLSSLSAGVRGITYAGNGYGGLFDGGQFGVYARSVAAGGSTVGVWGQVTSPSGWGGVFKGGQWGVWGESNVAGGYGGYFIGNGYFSGNVGIGVPVPAYQLHVVGQNLGIYGTESAANGAVGNPVAGIKGVAASGSYGYGVWGIATSQSGPNAGVTGNSYSPDGYGINGSNLATSGAATGIIGLSGSTSGQALYGSAYASSGVNYGVLGGTNSQTNGYGVFANGNLGSSGLKSFSIDHPLDPAHKFLNHFSAEGPEALLIYRGNVTLGNNGAAWVKLPAYFESINRDFSYQLTAIGAPAPSLYVASEIKDNRFMIAGGTAGQKISWTVTGVRNDVYARAYPKPVEEEKPADQAGKYLQPQLYGQPAEAGAFYRAPLPGEKTPLPPETPAQAEPAAALIEPIVPDVK